MVGVIVTHKAKRLAQRLRRCHFRSQCHSLTDRDSDERERTSLEFNTAKEHPGSVHRTINLSDPTISN